jgi:hypothetical protein
MEQCSWEANSHSASQEISCLLWKLKVHYRVHNSPLLAPILSQMNPAHTFPYYVPKIHSNVIFPSTPTSSEWCLPFSFSNQNIVLISHLVSARYMPLPSHPPWRDHPNNIWWSIQVMKLLIMLSCPGSPPPQPVPPSQTPSLCVLPLMWETKFHTHIKPVMMITE